MSDWIKRCPVCGYENDELADICANENCRVPIDHGVPVTRAGAPDDAAFETRVPAQSADERQAEVLWDSLRQGDLRNGTVRVIEDDGVVVDLGGLDGYLRGTDLPPGFQGSLRVGDALTVLVTGVARHRGRVYLAIPDTRERNGEEPGAAVPNGAETAGSASRDPATDFTYTFTEEITATSPAELGSLFFNDPQTAVEHVRSGVLVQAIGQHDQALAVQISQAIRLAKDERFAVLTAAYLLNPQLPFRLEDVGDAANPRELAALIDRDAASWEAGREALYDGTITAWLDAVGASPASAAWERTLQLFLEPEHRNAGLERFLHLLDPALAPPAMQISERSMAFELSHTSLQSTRTLRIRNAGRGWLSGTLAVADPPPWLQVSATSFAGAVAEITFRVDGSAFRSGETYSHTIQVTSNAGQPITLVVRARLRLAPQDLLGAVVGGVVGGALTALAARFCVGAVTGVGGAFLGTRFATPWALPDYLLHAFGLPEYVTWSILGAVIGGCIGLFRSRGGRSTPRLRWIAVGVPVALLLLFALITRPTAVESAQGHHFEAVLASALPGQWVGNVSGQPVALDLVVSGQTVTGTALFGGAVEHVTGSIGPSDYITLHGDEYVSIAWIGHFSLNTMTAALTGGAGLSGTYSAPTFNGDYTAQKVQPVDSLAGGWIGDVGGRPAVLLVENATLTGVSAELSYGGVKEELTGTPLPDGSVALQGTTYTDVTWTGGFDLDNLHGMNITPHTDEVTGYLTSGGSRVSWHFQRLTVATPAAAPVTDGEVGMGMAIPAGGTVTTPTLPWANAEIRVNATQPFAIKTTSGSFPVPQGGPTTTSWKWSEAGGSLILQSTGASVQEADFVITAASP